jgi:hypothetical protein
VSYASVLRRIVADDTLLAILAKIVRITASSGQQ